MSRFERALVAGLVVVAFTGTGRERDPGGPVGSRDEIVTMRAEVALSSTRALPGSSIGEVDPGDVFTVTGAST